MATPPTFTAGSVLTAAQMNTIGMHLVKTQTVGSGVSSVTVTGAFSADYDNYQIVWIGGASTTTNINLKLGSTTTGYYSNIIYAVPSTPAPAGLASNNGAYWNYIGDATSAGGTAVINIYSPYLAAKTYINGPYMGSGTSSGAFGFFAGNLNDTTSYTAFTLTPGIGTLTGGTIRIYGYRNS